MKTWLCKKLFIYAFLVILLLPTTVNGEDAVNSSIKVDRHWIYVFQLDELDMFEVIENFFINNTGKTMFNDSLHIWIQNNSVIAADCCNYTFDMACRFNATGGGDCFYLNRSNDANLYVGYPISSENKLSYYGQKESFSITAFSITDSSIKNDTLQLNATIGALSVPRKQESFQGDGIHLTSENHDVGMLPMAVTYMPFNIMAIENITIFNNCTDNEVIGFEISNLPQGWNAEVWNDTSRLSNVSLSPQELVNLSIIVTAPSNIASIYVRYITQVDIDENEIKEFFTKRYLYETEKVTYEVFLSTTDELDVSNDLEMVHDELFWRKEFERYWFIARNNDVQPNSYTTIGIKFGETTDNQSSTYVILLVLLAIVLVIVIFLFKRIDFFKEKGTLKKRDSSSEKSIKELQEQKKKVYSAIKRIEREFNDGIMSKEDYEQLRAAYKKRAVKILKEIDRLKK